MKKQNFVVLIVVQTIAVSHSILQEELGKDLPSNYNNDDIVSRKRRPLLGGGSAAGAASSGCNFNGFRRPKVDGTGRTFFDLQFINVGYDQNYNINCGGSGGHPTGGGGGNKPLGDFGQKPTFQQPGHHQHKPILGGLHHHGGQQESGEHNQGGGLANRPFLSMLLANRPLQGLFSQSQSQSQSQSDPYTNNKLPPGQYLSVSNPVFGTYTQDLSEFDYLNPFKIHKTIKQEVADFFGGLFAFRR